VDAQPPGSTPESRAGATQVGDVSSPRAPADRDDALAPLVPTGPPIRPVRRSRWRVVFAVVLAAIPLLCVGAIPLAFHSYDTATRPDRSAPDVVVHNYLQAFLAEPDDASARQFVCANPSGLADLANLRGDLEARERQYHVNLAVSWGALTVVSEGRDAASVTTTLSIVQASGSGGVGTRGEQNEEWTFGVVRTDEWRVCSAARTG
jgi:hypothetical protein